MLSGQNADPYVSAGLRTMFESLFCWVWRFRMKAVCARLHE